MASKDQIQQQINREKYKLVKLKARMRVAERKERTRRLIALGDAVLAAVSRDQYVRIDKDIEDWLRMQPLSQKNLIAWGLKIKIARVGKPTG